MRRGLRILYSIFFGLCQLTEKRYILLPYIIYSDVRNGMKTVVILRKPKASSANTGVGLYTDSIAKLLDDNSVEYGEVEMTMNLQSGYIKMFTNGFIRPFFEIMNLKKDTKIFHSADEFCCFFFPFMRKKKKVVTFHHVMSKKDKDSKFLLSWQLVAWIGVRWADRIVAISNQTRDEIMEKYGIDDSKIVVISNKLSEDIVTTGSEKKKFIGCVSTLTSRKNIGALLRSYRRFREEHGMTEYSLRICGKGPEEKNLRQQVTDLGIEEHVEFISDLDGKELVQFYNEASIIANPSLHEGFGRITLEAQLCSTPVVYFSQASIPEEVVRCAVPSEDEADFAYKMYELLNDRELYDDVVDKALSYARTYQGTPKELLDVYEELLSGSS